jgi:hypothetical protein
VASAFFKNALRCGGAFVSVAARIAIWVETAVDIKEVGDLGELVFGQLGQVVDPGIRGVTRGDAHQLRLAPVPGQDPENSDEPSANPNPRIRRLQSEYHGVQRFIVGPQRARNVAVVGGEGEGTGQPAVKPDLPGIFVDLVFVPATPWSLYHYLDHLHAQQDRRRCCQQVIAAVTALQAGENLSDLDGAEGYTRWCVARTFTDVKLAGKLLRLILRVENRHRDAAAALRGKPVCGASTVLACHSRRVFLQMLSSFIYRYAALDVNFDEYRVHRASQEELRTYWLSGPEITLTYRFGPRRRHGQKS